MRTMPLGCRSAHALRVLAARVAVLASAPHLPPPGTNAHFQAHSSTCIINEAADGCLQSSDESGAR